MGTIKNLLQKFSCKIGYDKPTSEEILQIINNVSITMDDIKSISEFNSKLKYSNVNAAIARFTEKRAKIMNISTLASITSSLSRSNYFDKSFYMKISEVYLSRIHESNTIDAATMCHAYSLLSPPPIIKIFMNTGDLLVKNDMISQLSARNSAHLLNSFSRANVQHITLFTQILKHIQSLPLGNLEIHHSTLVLNALAKFSIVDRCAIDNLLEHMKLNIYNLKPENIANAIHALAKLNHESALIKELSKQLFLMAPCMGVRELSNCLWGLSKLKHLKIDQFITCFKFIEMKTDETINDDKSVAQLMESLRRIDRDSLSKDIICKVITTIVNPLIRKIETLSLPVLTQISWCLVDLDEANHEFVKKSFEQFNARKVDKASTEWAYVKLLARTINERCPELVEILKLIN